MSSDFEPATDVPQHIDDDDSPVESDASMRDRSIRKRRMRALTLLIVVTGVGLVVAGFPVGRVLIALLLMYVLLRVGFAAIGALARPIPEPPPPGELRKVKLLYRCSSCGAEMKMTLASDQDPAPPRHCADEMELQTPSL